ncbi:MAG: hypothetical protein HYT16_03785 [DPANN group archaeon]|nr:hypothetical protein [DPANN group archaeon]
MEGRLAKLDFSMVLRLIGAVLSSIGFFLTALKQPVLGAIFIGFGGVMLALGSGQ